MQNETKKELHTQMWKVENPKDCTPHDREVREKAAAIIRAGGLVAFPTETVYGLGANALDEAAAKKIYAAKGRPSDNPLIAHVSCLEEIAPLVSNMPENGKKLAKAYWPGPVSYTHLIPSFPFLIGFSLQAGVTIRTEKNRRAAGSRLRG